MPSYQLTNNEQVFVRNKIIYLLRFISVEPTLYLYMLAFMTTSVLENAFFVDKACRVNHNFNSTVCNDIANKKYKDLLKEVQITVSNFNYKNGIASHVGQIILAFFMGAWSDKRGRKMPLLLGLSGKLFYSLMIVVNSLNPTWPVEYIIYTATLPMSFTGADVAIFASAFAYLVDISSEENRTLRLTLLEVIYLSTMPTGVALGNYLFAKVNKNFTTMFTINASIMVISILYSLIVLKWRTNSKQSQMPSHCKILPDFFDLKHVKSTLQTLFKKREFSYRHYLLLLIITMGLYTFQRDERPSFYNYAQAVFNWEISEISNFFTFKSAFQVFGLLAIVPLTSRIFGWKDASIACLGAVAHITARFFFIAGKTKQIIYIGGAFASLGPIVAPVVRSMVSKIILPAEKGKVFSILSVADNAIPVISGVVYSKVYNATLYNMPNTFFFVTIISQSGVLLSSLYIYFTRPQFQIETGDKIEDENEVAQEEPRISDR